MYIENISEVQHFAKFLKTNSGFSMVSAMMAMGMVLSSGYAFMSMSEKDKYLKKNKHIKQILKAINIVSGTGSTNIRTDGGWKEVQSKIAERNPGPPFAERHGRASTKDIKTRQVLKKHGILPK